MPRSTDQAPEDNKLRNAFFIVLWSEQEVLFPGKGRRHIRTRNERRKVRPKAALPKQGRAGILWKQVLLRRQKGESLLGLVGMYR